jgi:hypothetical protein
MDKTFQLFSVETFMSDMNPSRLGQKNAAGDDDALFLKVYSGEVLHAFAETNVALMRSMVREIESGKSAQFPATWKGTASYHTPGATLTGTAVAHNERVITIDDLLVADRFIALIDEAKSHVDYRSFYSSDAGRALAQTLDKNLLQVGLLAARASATVTGGNGGTAITDADAATNADSLVGSIFDCAQAYDEKDVPADERFVFLKPAQYYLLVESSSKAINRDYDGAGSISGGVITRVAGIQIVASNNVPQANVATGPTAYQGDFSTTVGLSWQRTAVGTVKLLDLATEMDYLIQNQGTLVVAKYAMGHGILRPESAVEIKSS